MKLFGNFKTFTIFSVILLGASLKASANYESTMEYDVNKTTATSSTFVTYDIGGGAVFYSTEKVPAGEVVSANASIPVAPSYKVTASWSTGLSCTATFPHLPSAITITHSSIYGACQIQAAPPAYVTVQTIVVNQTGSSAIFAMTVNENGQNQTDNALLANGASSMFVNQLAGTSGSYTVLPTFTVITPFGQAKGQCPTSLTYSSPVGINVILTAIRPVSMFNPIGIYTCTVNH